MLVKTITCSGINEDNDISEAIAFLKKYKTAEFGVQCSPKKMSVHTPRFEWLGELAAKLKESGLKGRVALHLNEGFATSFCMGKMPGEIISLMGDNEAIGRLQINYNINRDVLENGRKVPAASDISQALKNAHPHRIIFSASKPNLPLIRQIYSRQKNFDVLFDDSFGEGIMPKTRAKPLFDDVFQGYAGGLSPENVMGELDKINVVATHPVFIDAEGKLKENGKFSFARAEKYVQNALLWQAQNSKQLQEEQIY